MREPFSKDIRAHKVRWAEHGLLSTTLAQEPFRTHSAETLQWEATVAAVEAEQDALRKMVQRFVDKHGQERCWYFPDLFNEMAQTLGITARAPAQLPPRADFEAGCARYQGEQYGTAEPHGQRDE